MSGKDRHQQPSHPPANDLGGPPPPIQQGQAAAPISPAHGSGADKGLLGSVVWVPDKDGAVLPIVGYSFASRLQQLPTHLPALASQYVKCIHGGWCRHHCRNPPVGSLLNSGSNTTTQRDKENRSDGDSGDSWPAQETPGHARAEERQPPRSANLSSIHPANSPVEQSALGEGFQLRTPEGWRQPQRSGDEHRRLDGARDGAGGENGGGAANSDGYETDDSGSRASKLARREKLRQKIIERTGCDYGGAVLALATVDARRRDPYSLIYRGDAWRLGQACELIITRQAELKAEQKEKWRQEVKLATKCTSSMAYLAVEAAEREPTLVRNGKLQAQELVRWAVVWIEERKAKRRTAEQEYEAGYVEHMQRVKAAKEREQRNSASQRQAREAATGGGENADAPGEEKRQAKLCLTREALSILTQISEPMSEMLPPLNLEDGAVTELTAELMAAAHDTFGEDIAPFEPKLALCALEAGRYLPGQHGWPSVSAAMRCLQRIQRQELWMWECEEVSRLTGVNLVDARSLLRQAQDSQPKAPNLIAVAVQLWGSQQQPAKGATASQEHTDGNNGPSQVGKRRTRGNDEKEDEDERAEQRDLSEGVRKAGGGNAANVGNSNSALKTNSGGAKGAATSEGGGCNDNKPRNRENDDEEDEDERAGQRDLPGGVRRAGGSSTINNGGGDSLH